MSICHIICTSESLQSCQSDFGSKQKIPIYHLSDLQVVALAMAESEVAARPAAGSREFAQARAGAKLTKCTLDLQGKLREVMLGNFESYMDQVVVS